MTLLIRRQAGDEVRVGKHRLKLLRHSKINADFTFDGERFSLQKHERAYPSSRVGVTLCRSGDRWTTIGIDAPKIMEIS